MHREPSACRAGTAPDCASCPPSAARPNHSPGSCPAEYSCDTRNRKRAARRWRAILFVVVQGVSWWRIIPQSFEETPGLESKDLRKAGLKVTGPRLKILEILEGSATRHMSAEGSYKRLIESNEDIGLATVYRVLTQFQAAGLVSRHHFEDGMAVFELNQGTHHDHIVCLDCGRVEEFVDESIEERQEAIARRLGYELRDHAMTLYGHCQKPGCPSFQGSKPGKAS